MNTAPNRTSLPAQGRNDDALRMVIWLTRLAQQGKRHIYEGTVPAATKAKRRAANKVARASRKQNRSKR